MSFHSWLQVLRAALPPLRGQRHDKRRGSLRAAAHRPNLEVLEDRLTPSFSWQQAYSEAPPGVVWSPSGLQYADLTGDGILDQIGPGVQTVVVWPGRGDGTFGGGIESYSPNSYPWAGDVLAVADFNGDARLDVFTASRTGSWAQDHMPVVGDALLGLGDGTFYFEGSYQLGITWPTGIGTVGIGQADVVVAGQASDYSDGTDTFVELFNDGNWPPPGAAAAPRSADLHQRRDAHRGQHRHGGGHLHRDPFARLQR